ncbi:hypothetical protein BpHYR1_010841 [Brachionus plicatilis]|uniref:Uncharacterized protein n=1 Tax=Brachionus plicatilis TaxID=10195 RepID=A0A3M7RWJ4_BRAPC|nr:hypothetical protein BpHYR1_010841 [Brachionus plicatilis]
MIKIENIIEMYKGKRKEDKNLIYLTKKKYFFSKFVYCWYLYGVDPLHCNYYHLPCIPELEN